MDFKDSQYRYEYDFGYMYCYANYVIGQVHKDIVVTNEIAMRMLTDINDYYKKKKIIFISNREFGHSVDPKVYQLVNSKTLVGIAIVGKSKEQKIQAAQEQSLYNGSFGYFNHIDSAIEWAKSFDLDSNTLSAG